MDIKSVISRPLRKQKVSIDTLANILTFISYRDMNLHSLYEFIIDFGYINKAKTLLEKFYSSEYINRLHTSYLEKYVIYGLRYIIFSGPFLLQTMGLSNNPSYTAYVENDQFMLINYSRSILKYNNIKNKIKRVYEVETMGYDKTRFQDIVIVNSNKDFKNIQKEHLNFDLYTNTLEVKIDPQTDEKVPIKSKYTYTFKFGTSIQRLISKEMTIINPSNACDFIEEIKDALADNFTIIP